VQRLLPRHLCHALTAKAYAGGGVAFEQPLSRATCQSSHHTLLVLLNS